HGRSLSRPGWSSPAGPPVCSGSGRHLVDEAVYVADLAVGVHLGDVEADHDRLGAWGRDEIPGEANDAVVLIVGGAPHELQSGELLPGRADELVEAVPAR